MFFNDIIQFINHFCQARKQWRNPVNLLKQTQFHHILSILGRILSYFIIMDKSIIFLKISKCYLQMFLPRIRSETVVFTYSGVHGGNQSNMFPIIYCSISNSGRGSKQVQVPLNYLYHRLQHLQCIPQIVASTMYQQHLHFYQAS